MDPVPERPTYRRRIHQTQCEQVLVLMPRPVLHIDLPTAKLGYRDTRCVLAGIRRYAAEPLSMDTRAVASRLALKFVCVRATCDGTELSIVTGRGIVRRTARPCVSDSRVPRGRETFCRLTRTAEDGTGVPEGGIIQPDPVIFALKAARRGRLPVSWQRRRRGCCRARHSAIRGCFLSSNQASRIVQRVVSIRVGLMVRKGLP